MLNHDRYSILYFDPPWWFNKRGNQDSRFGLGIWGHYPPMKINDIVAMGDNGLDDLLAIRDIASVDCALFLWVPCSKVHWGLEVIRRWGFRFACIPFIWEKVDKRGKLRKLPGSYTATETELMLLGVKGSMPPFTKMLDQIVRHPITKQHSEKPAVFRDLIDLMYPPTRFGPRLEGFARHNADGWDAWGNEVGKLDYREAIDGNRETAVC